jgi:hypothetical protein
LFSPLTALKQATSIGVAIGEGATNDDDDDGDGAAAWEGVGEDASVPQGTGAMRCFFFLAVRTCTVLPADASTGAAPLMVVTALVVEPACAADGSVLEAPSIAMAGAAVAAAVAATVVAALAAVAIVELAAALVEAAAAVEAGAGFGFAAIAWA